MTISAVTFLEDKVWSVEGDIPVVEGESITFSCTFWTTATSPTCKVYRNRSSTDIAATVMPSGSHTASGAVVTLKPATAMVGGSRYVFAVTVTINGNTRIKKFLAICQKDEQQ